MLHLMSRYKEDPVFNRIEELRSQAGISRQDLAKTVGVHYQTIGYLERGEYSPSLALALKIAEALQSSVSQIFSNTPFKKGSSKWQENHQGAKAGRDYSPNSALGLSACMKWRNSLKTKGPLGTGNYARRRSAGGYANFQPPNFRCSRWIPRWATDSAW